MMAAVTSEGANELVGRRAAEHEVAALFRAEYRSLVRLARLLLGDPGAAEEVVQDAFVKLQVGWSRLRDPEHAPAWLRSAVLNGARSRLRHVQVRRRHLSAAAGAPTPDTGGADAAAVEGDERRRMMAALRTLPPRQREALVLKFYLDLSEAETAATMGVSAGSVKTHVHRGLAALETVLQEEER